MTALALLLAPASAYVWDVDEAPTTDELTIHLCLGDFGPRIETEIFEGADAWQAGEGRILRGAVWTYVRGDDRPDGSCGPGNGYNEIHAEDDGWFADHDAGGALATTMNDDVSVDDEVDFVFNTIDEANWSSRKPSKTPDGQYSLGMIALHEFGHGLGFNHDDAVVAVMNSSYPNGGDLAREYHPNGDDYAGLAVNRPGPSTGTNVLLGKFVEEPGDPGDSVEVWDVATDAWTACRELVDGASGPEPITAAIHETDGPTPVVVAWRLSSDLNCFAGVEYEVGREVLDMSTGDPVLAQPDTYDFGAVPAGDYTLCARIDADGAIAEIREGDNSVRSEARVTVLDCP